MGKIEQLIESKDGLVRSVVLRTGTKKRLTRAVQGISLLPLVHESTQNKSDVIQDEATRAKLINTFYSSAANMSIEYFERPLPRKKENIVVNDKN